MSNETKIPAGFVLVPVEPTEEMLRAGENLMLNSYSTSEIVEGWRAMIAAAPAATPAAAEEPVMWQYRWTNPDGETGHPARMFAWKEVEPGWNQTIADKVRELRAYEHRGKPCYEVRALYAEPPAATQPQAAEREALSDAVPSPAPAPAPDPADTVQLVGVKDGVETVIGTATMSPRMKAQDLVREMFGAWEHDDGSDADMAFAVCEQLIKWMPQHPPVFNVPSPAVGAES